MGRRAFTIYNVDPQDMYSVYVYAIDMNNTKPRLAKYDHTIYMDGIKCSNLEEAQRQYNIIYEGGPALKVTFDDGSFELWNH